MQVYCCVACERSRDVLHRLQLFCSYPPAILQLFFARLVETLGYTRLLRALRSRAKSRYSSQVDNTHAAPVAIQRLSKATRQCLLALERLNERLLVVSQQQLPKMRALHRVAQSYASPTHLSRLYWLFDLPVCTQQRHAAARTIIEIRSCRNVL